MAWKSIAKKHELKSNEVEAFLNRTSLNLLDEDLLNIYDNTTKYLLPYIRQLTALEQQENCCKLVTGNKYPSHIYENIHDDKI